MIKHFRKVSLVTITLLLFSGLAYADSGVVEFKKDIYAFGSDALKEETEGLRKKQAEYEKNILAFNINGVKLGMGVKEFKAKFPKIEREISESNIGIFEEIYKVEKLNNSVLTEFRFFEGKLYFIDVVYRSKEGDKNYWKNFLSTFEARYGKFMEKPSAEAVYNGYILFDKVGRYMQFSVMQNNEISVVYVDWLTARKLAIKLEELNYTENKK